MRILMSIPAWRRSSQSIIDWPGFGSVQATVEHEPEHYVQVHKVRFMFEHCSYIKNSKFNEIYKKKNYS